MELNRRKISPKSFEMLSPPLIIITSTIPGFKIKKMYHNVFKILSNGFIISSAFQFCFIASPVSIFNPKAKLCNSQQVRFFISNLSSFKLIKLVLNQIRFIKTKIIKILIFLYCNK